MPASRAYSRAALQRSDGSIPLRLHWEMSCWFEDSDLLRQRHHFLVAAGGLGATRWPLLPELLLQRLSGGGSPPRDCPSLQYRGSNFGAQDQASPLVTGYTQAHQALEECPVEVRGWGSRL